jgi:hypothetical protein
MIIRATQQLIRLSGIPSVKNTEEPTSPFPGEWYANFVERFDGRLLFQYGLLSPAEFYATNSRSILASMNQMRYEIDYHLSMPETIKEINLDRIEDLEFENIFRTSKELKDITTPARILHELMSKL